jgi:hypothetical protein
MDVNLKLPHPKQIELWELGLRSVPGVNIFNAVWGRGTGKTAIAAVFLYHAATTFNRGLPHLWTSPTYRDCLDTFMRTWADVIPPECYTFHKADMMIDIHDGGGTIDVRSRQIDNTKKEPFRGPTYAGGWLDEPAKDKDDKAWGLILACMRHPRAGQLFLGSSTTPKLGWYHNKIVDIGQDNVVYATSYDNPYISPDWVDALLDDYTPEFARQEIYAEWISQQSRAWDNADLSKRWPDGNLHTHEHDFDKPFILMCDIGVKSAWLVCQWAEDRSRYASIGRPRRSDVLVATAEYTPNDGDTDRMVSRIQADYGIPQRVIVGADVNTRSVTDGSTSATMFASRGWHNVQPITGHLRDKQMQYMAAKRTLRNARGYRLFCVSEQLKSHDKTPRNQRGIIEVLNQDAWPENTIRTGEFLPKDKNTGVGLEDMRDAWMYGMCAIFPLQDHRQDAAA